MNELQHGETEQEEDEPPDPFELDDLLPF